MYLNKMKNLEASASRKSEIKFYNLVKVGLLGPERGGGEGGGRSASTPCPFCS